MSDVRVTNNPQMSQYEAFIGEERAGVAMYRPRDGALVFTHTIVDPEFGGKGVGSALVRTALDEVRAAGEHKVVPECSFVASWIEKHPDYQDLLA